LKKEFVDSKQIYRKAKIPVLSALFNLASYRRGGSGGREVYY
jgi:hypothetical protein